MAGRLVLQLDDTLRKIKEEKDARAEAERAAAEARERTKHM